MNFKLADHKGNAIDVCLYHILHALIDALAMVEDGSSELVLMVSPSEAECVHCAGTMSEEAVETAKGLPVN